jgi:hypothetical protein
VSAHPRAAFLDAKRTAARHIGTLLREARHMALANAESGPCPAVGLSAKRLREALDSLTKQLGAS